MNVKPGATIGVDELIAHTEVFFTGGRGQTEGFVALIWHAQPVFTRVRRTSQFHAPDRREVLTAYMNPSAPRSSRGKRRRGSWVGGRVGV
jgi:hypothetical protein